jgi:DNA polymerase-3 subunit gamma/tau
MLSGAAFNALLKIMEEPPSYIVFILCTTEVHKIPATIISRCQRFDFKKISINDVIRKLSYIARQEKIDVDRSILEAVARFSGGHMRDAESTLGQIMSVGESNVITQAAAELVIPRNNLIEVLNLFELLAIKDSAGSIYLVNKLLDDGFDLKIFCADLIEVLRQALLVKINPELIAGISVELGEDLSARLSSVTRQLSLAQILKYLERFIKAQGEIKDNLIIQLPLEMAIAELGLELSAPKIATPPSPDNSAAPSAIPATVEVEVKKEPILVGDFSPFSSTQPKR